jgi:hypothetical protein
LSIIVLPCIYVSDMNPPYGAAWSITMTVQLAKNGGQVSGTVAVVQDTTPAISCASGTTTTGSLTLTPLSTAYDNDWQENPPRGDGCPDYKELQATAGSQTAGGLRDPFNPYDYFNPTHDGLNRIDDILAVVRQYFHDDTDPPPGLPPYSQDYNPDTDRTPVGPNVWNLGPPDGTQHVPDILAVLKQYFHDCS